MARANAAKAAKGHNSSGDVQKTIQELAERQLKLNKKRRATNAKFAEEHSEITSELKECGLSRKAFALAFGLYELEAGADSDEERKEAADQNVVYLDQFHTAFKALNKGKTLNWLDVTAKAEKAREAAAKAEQEGEAGEVDV